MSALASSAATPIRSSPGVSSHQPQVPTKEEGRWGRWIQCQGLSAWAPGLSSRLSLPVPIRGAPVLYFGI